MSPTLAVMTTYPRQRWSAASTKISRECSRRRWSAIATTTTTPPPGVGHGTQRHQVLPSSVFKPTKGEELTASSSFHFESPYRQAGRDDRTRSTPIIQCTIKGSIGQCSPSPTTKIEWARRIPRAKNAEEMKELREQPPMNAAQRGQCPERPVCETGFPILERWQSRAGGQHGPIADLKGCRQGGN